MDRNPNLVLLDDRVDLHVTENAGVNPDLHLERSGNLRGMRDSSSGNIVARDNGSGIEPLMDWRKVGGRP